MTRIDEIFVTWNKLKGEIILLNKKEVVLTVSSFLAGVGVCAAAQLLKTPVGKLVIDNTNPEKTLYNFNIDNLEVLDNKKRLVLKIERVNAQQ